MRLNLRHIEVFRAIMLTSSISGAAKLLGVSQPAVSRLLAHMEQRLGIALFERIKARIYPTPEAHQLYTEVNAVYQSLQRVNELAEDMVGNRMGKLRIGCTPSLGQSLIPRAIARFHEVYADTEIVLHTMIPGVLLQAVLTKQVELGVAVLQETHPSLASTPLYENRILAAIPMNHPLADLESIAIRDLVDEPIIGYGSDLPLGQLLRKLFQQEDRAPRVKTEVQQAHVACALVQAGAGIALIDELTASGPSWSNVALRTLRPAITAPVTAIHPVVEPLSRLAKQFIATLEALKASDLS